LKLYSEKVTEMRICTITFFLKIDRKPRLVPRGRWMQKNSKLIRIFAPRVLFFTLAAAGFVSQYTVPWLHKCPVLNPTEASASKTRSLTHEHCHNAGEKSASSDENGGHSHSLCSVCQGYLHSSWFSEKKLSPVLAIVEKTESTLIDAAPAGKHGFAFIPSARAPPHS